MNQDADVVVAGGHSIWFREFFKTYLPFDSECLGKKKKIVNCGMVSFDLTFGVHPSTARCTPSKTCEKFTAGFRNEHHSVINVSSSLCAAMSGGIIMILRLCAPVITHHRVYRRR